MYTKISCVMFLNITQFSLTSNACTTNTLARNFCICSWIIIFNTSFIKPITKPSSTSNVKRHTELRTRNCHRIWCSPLLNHKTFNTKSFNRRKKPTVNNALQNIICSKHIQNEKSHILINTICHEIHGNEVFGTEVWKVMIPFLKPQF